MAKRIPVYTNDLEEYIEIIQKQLLIVAENLNDVLRKNTEKSNPPFPITQLGKIFDSYHTSTLGLVALSSVLMMHRDMKETSTYILENCASEYINLKSRNSGLPGHANTGTEDVTIDDEYFDKFDEVADYFIANDVKVPYLKRAGKTSHKVIIGIAIIYAGRILKEENEKENASE